MAYELSFSPEFFYNEESGPTSLYGAIEQAAQDPEEWARIASYFEVEPEYLAVDTVYDRAREINTCSNLTVPVQVWLDEGGWCTVGVEESSE